MTAGVYRRTLGCMVLVAGMGMASAAPSLPAGLSTGFHVGKPRVHIRPDGSQASLKKAAAGDVHAQMAMAAYDLANLRYGEGVRWLKAAAEQGFAPAENALGLAYYRGTGVPVNVTQAQSWFYKAASAGDSGGENNLGVLSDTLDNGSSQGSYQVVLWFLRSASQGFAVAENNLGLAYQQGYGVSQDFGKAASWFRKAALQGNVEAENNLGYEYMHGKGLAIDYGKAAYWFKRAAAKQNVAAQYNLGLLYKSGHGIGKNAVKAVFYFRLAADAGMAAAQNQLGLAYYYGRGVYKDYPTAEHWFLLAANQQYAPAMKNLHTLPNVQP